MAKGVVMGVLCCVTLLPSLVLVIINGCRKNKRNRPLFSNMNKPSEFITKHYAVWIVLFLVLLFPANLRKQPYEDLL